MSSYKILENYHNKQFINDNTYLITVLTSVFFIFLIIILLITFYYVFDYPKNFKMIK
jgi:hypothetical protein